jgi:hypothetical protein
MPEALKLPDTVQSVVMLKSTPGGHFEAVEVYQPEGVSKSTSKKYKGVERVVRRVVRAHAKALQSYTERHERSAGKKKDGWYKDFGKNIKASMKDGRKVIKVKSLF